MSTEHSITVCLGSSCFARGNKTILEIVKSFLSDHQLDDKIFFRGELCTGNCEQGPVLKIDDQLFTAIDPNSVYQILSDFFNV